MIWKLVVSSMLLGFALASCDVPMLTDADIQPAPVDDRQAQQRDASADDPVGDDDTPPAAAGDAEVAVYMGWRATAQVTAFSEWLGRPVWAHDFLDHRQGWGVIADPRPQLDAWSRWVAQDADRRLVLSVPLLTTASAGDFAGVAAGAYDRHFAELARNLVDVGLQDTVIRLGWEFNGNTFPWAVHPGQVADYKRAWTRAVTVMRDVDGAAFAFDWCPNIQLDATGLPFAQIYPGDDVVDIIGLGFYDYYWNHPGASPEARWRWLRDSPNGLAEHRAFAAAHDKPISFPEYGLWAQGTDTGGGGDDPYFITQLASWITDSDLVYHGYNNVDATADHRLSSYPNAQRVYRDAFGD